MNFIFEGSVCSDLNDVKVFIGQVLDKLEKILNDDNLIFEVRLILNELIINGVVHGNKCNRNKNVYLFLQVKDNSIRIEVIDEGPGFSYDESCYNPKELKCCGRGLVIVGGLSDEFILTKIG